VSSMEGLARREVRGTSWAAEMVVELREHRHAGLSFDEAWAAALKVHPAFGIHTKVDYTGDRRGRLPLDPQGFFREACRQAWHDEYPELRGLFAEA
jgi:hypothetical protein